MVRGALEMGYTVAWDADERKWIQFPQRHGAVARGGRQSKLEGVVREQKVTQRTRQIQFENHTTTDDHLMHIVGPTPKTKMGKSIL